MTIYIRLDMDGLFCAEHLVKASQRRSLNLVRASPEHLMNASRRCSMNLVRGTVRALRECEPKTYRIFHQHLNTTKYTAVPVYNVLYDAIAL